MTSMNSLIEYHGLLIDRNVSASRLIRDVSARSIGAVHTVSSQTQPERPRVPSSMIELYF